MDPKVSIITPCYNSATYISTAIESVISQTYAHWEMLIIDDASFDNTVSIVNDYTIKDQRIKLIRLEKNSGAAIARNTGLKKMSGTLVAFLDCDDCWMPNKLELQVRLMVRHNWDISFTEYRNMDEKLESELAYVKVPDRIDYKGYLKNTIIGMSTSMINTLNVAPFEFYNIRTRQDTYLWITLLKRGHIAYGIHECLVSYRIHSGSISSDKIKAARRVWYLYYNLEKMNIMQAAFYFSLYLFNAVKKRLNL
jgi:teichuronic acid biosynthesis glycosyltransferase TuaG